MLINDIRRPSYLKKKSLRRGRGNSSWRGNYSGRWLKGQKARTWFSLHPDFEWGQTPLFQRLPKNRWFKRYFKLIKVYTPVNLWKLENDERIKDGDIINKEKLVELGYIKEKEEVKILGTWSLKKKITFKWLFVSKKAEKKILEVGWLIE